MNSIILEDMYKVRDLYTELYAITHELMVNYSDENAIETIEKRKQILKEISHFENDSKHFLKSASSLSIEIRNIIAKVIEIDAAVNSKMQSRLTQIRSEITGLNHTSRAAVAYSSHRK
jgi:hypothetical protein